MRDVLYSLPKGSVNCFVSSPPYYAARKYEDVNPTWWGGNKHCQHEPYGEHNVCSKCFARYQTLGNESCIDDYISNMVECFDAMKFALHDTGTVWLNIGDIHINGKLAMIPERLAITLEKQGWKVVDIIVWAKGNSFAQPCKKCGSPGYVGSIMPSSVKSRPTQSHEYIYIFAKDNKVKHYYDWFGVREDGVYPAGTQAAKGSENRKNQEGVNARPAEYKIYDGKRNLRTVWSIPVERKSQEYGHFAAFSESLVTPAIQAGCSQGGRCSKCFAPLKRDIRPTREYSSILGKDWADYETDEKEGRGHFETQNGKAQTRPSKRKASSTSAGYEHIGWGNICSCGEETEKAVVCDPFGGLGTTAVAAERLGVDSIIIEISSEYCDIAERYIRDKLGNKVEIIRE